MGFGHFIHKVTHSVEHAVKNTVKVAEKSVVNTVKAPERAVKSAIAVVKDVSTGHFGHALNDLKGVLDPAHVVGLSHQLNRPITNPINKALAQGIKGATGHNVLGSHPLNTVGTVAAGIATGGAASALMAGATLAEAAMAGVGALEGAVGAGVGAVGSGLSTVGLDAAGQAVSGWGSALQAAAAGNAFASGAVESAVTSAPSSWSATNSGSVFNGGYGATGSNAGFSTGLSSTGSAQAGLTNSFAAAGSQGAADTLVNPATQSVGGWANFGAQQAAHGTELGTSGLSFGDAAAGGYNSMTAQAAAGQLGTNGAGVYGESAGGTVANAANHGMLTGSEIFNTQSTTGYATAEQNRWKDAIKSTQTKSNTSTTTPSTQQAQTAAAGQDAMSLKKSSMDLTPAKFNFLTYDNMNLGLTAPKLINPDEFKPQEEFKINSNAAPIQFTNF